MTESKKSKLGQFYTTNYKHILQNLTIPESETCIIEPFAGAGHLLNFLDDSKWSNSNSNSNSKYTIEAYDIDPKNDNIVKRDTLNSPPEYSNKFVLTNPPYLARNKSNTKSLFDKYKTNDLYKCFIKQLILDPCNGGIIIIPLNFWCSIRKADIELRRDFLKIYNIITVNIFEEQVFEDTGYTTCSFLFVNNNTNFLFVNNNTNNENNKLDLELKLENNNKYIDVYVFGLKNSKTHLNIELNSENNYTFGGHIYNLEQCEKIQIERLTHKNKNNENITNILLKCIDDSAKNKICLSITKDSERYIDNSPNLSARSYATLIISPKLNHEQQLKLVELFNSYLAVERQKYHSLFLTNYRENGRKRISFSLAFEIINYLIKLHKLDS